MKINRGKKDRILWISILFLAIIAYGIGLITGKYHIFPYQQIKHIKNFMVADKKNNLKAGTKTNKYYYSDKKSFFEVNGSKADIVMIGGSIIDRAEWNELFSNISIVKNQNNGVYLIDSDEDGRYDLEYNVITGSMNYLSEDEVLVNDVFVDDNLIIILIIIVYISGILLFYYLTKKQKLNNR